MVINKGSRGALWKLSFGFKLYMETRHINIYVTAIFLLPPLQKLSNILHVVLTWFYTWL